MNFLDVILLEYNREMGLVWDKECTYDDIVKGKLAVQKRHIETLLRYDISATLTRLGIQQQGDKLIKVLRLL